MCGGLTLRGAIDKYQITTKIDQTLISLVEFHNTIKKLLESTMKASNYSLNALAASSREIVLMNVENVMLLYGK